VEDTLPNARPGDIRYVVWPRLRTWRAVIAASLVAVLAAVIAASLDFTQLGAAFETLPQNPATVVAMVAGYTAAFWLRALAWRALLSTPICPPMMARCRRTALT